MRLLLQREKKVLEIRNLVPRQNHFQNAKGRLDFLGWWGREPGVLWIDGIASRGRIYAISGVGNYLSAHAQRLVPRQFVTQR